MTRLVHAWDAGLLHRWWHAQPENVAERFVAHVREHGKAAYYTVVALDCDGPTWRHDLFHGYKASRVDTPDRRAIREQMIITAKLFRKAGIKTLQVSGYEADDILATVARRATDQGFDVVIFSGDKDLAQLLSTHVKLHNDRDWVTAESIVKRYGVRPDQLRDFLSITGDSGDDVPGVRGMGPVAAKEILSKYPTLAAALERASYEAQYFMTKDQDKLLCKLLAGEREAILSYELIGLTNNVAIGRRHEDSKTEGELGSRGQDRR